MNAARPTFPCPHCGADVRVGSAVCRACGSDELTGWCDGEELDYQSVAIPDDLGPLDQLEHDRRREHRRARFAAVVSLLLVACFLLWVLFR